MFRSKLSSHHQTTKNKPFPCVRAWKNKLKLWVKILATFCFMCHTDLMSQEAVPKSWLGVKSSSFIRLVRSSLGCRRCKNQRQAGPAPPPWVKMCFLTLTILSRVSSFRRYPGTSMPGVTHPEIYEVLTLTEKHLNLNNGQCNKFNFY